MIQVLTKDKQKLSKKLMLLLESIANLKKKSVKQTDSHAQFQTLDITETSDQISAPFARDGILIVGEVRPDQAKSANLSQHGPRSNSVNAFQFYEQSVQPSQAKDSSRLERSDRT